MRTHIKNIVIFFHSMSGMQVASGKFSTAPGEAEVTRMESEVSFLQVKATMSLKERLVKVEICDNRRQIAHVRLESLVGAENPYSLKQVFGIKEWSHCVCHQMSGSRGGASSAHRDSGHV
jgi:hypothetical protein